MKTSLNMVEKLLWRYNNKLSIGAKTLEGVVVKKVGKNTVKVLVKSLVKAYPRKYNLYSKVKKYFIVHDVFNSNINDKVLLALLCYKISKTKSSVILENKTL